LCFNSFIFIQPNEVKVKEEDLSSLTAFRITQKPLEINMLILEDFLTE